MTCPLFVELTAGLGSVSLRLQGGPHCRPPVSRMGNKAGYAGATVCISEAEPIPELMAEGWHSVEITGTRKGQKRTFSKQQREWLTLNREPCWRPSVTLDLFGGGQ